MNPLLLPAASPEDEAKDFALSILTKLALNIVLPEAFVPLTIIQTAVGLATDPNKYLKYIETAKNVTQTLNNVLDILVKLKQLGIIGSSTDNIPDALTRIAKALEVKLPDDSTVGIAQVILDSLSADFSENDVTVKKNLAEIFKVLLSELSWTADNGHRFPLGESLGRAAFTGYMTPYPQDF